MSSSTTPRRRNWNVRGATMSTWHPTRLLTGYAWDAITAGCLLGPQPPRTLLMLGLGGGTVLRQLLHLLPNLEVVAIDLDPRALRSATTNLGSLADRVTMIQAEAYGWLEQCHSRFEVIIDDVYAAGADDVYRPVFFDQRLAQTLRSKTTAGGLVIANFIIGGDHHRQHLQARRAFKSTFAQFRSIRPELGFNSILVGGNTVRPGSALKTWSSQWTKTDRRHWEKLRVRLG